MSGLLLSSTSAPEVLTVQHDAVAEKLLGAPPTGRREFAQNETLALVTEIYDNLTPQRPRHIDVAVRLTSENGVDTFASRDSLTNGSSDSATWTALAYAGQIPLKNVAPGRYVLTVEARDRDNSGTTATVQTVVTIAADK
jgi:hypothetical protein